jgi:hypothetical protein
MDVDVLKVLAPVFGASLVAVLGFWAQQGSARRRLRREIKEALEVVELLDRRGQVSVGLERNLDSLFARYLPSPEVRLRRVSRRYLTPAAFIGGFGMALVVAGVLNLTTLSGWRYGALYAGACVAAGIGIQLLLSHVENRIGEAYRQDPWTEPLPVPAAPVKKPKQ